MLIIQPVGLRFKARQPPAPWDYNTAPFATLDASTDFDLSAIVPAKAKLVYLHCYAIGNAANLIFGIRPNGFTGAAGYWNVPIMVAGVGHEACGIVPIDKNGIVEYYRSTGITTCTLTVLGWFY